MADKIHKKKIERSVELICTGIMRPTRNAVKIFRKKRAAGQKIQ